MHLIFRKILWAIRSRFAQPIGLHDLSRITMRAQLTDIDELRHINNGQYSSLMDIGRNDLMIRAGTIPVFRANKWYPVVASATTTFRKSINLFERFSLETQIVGYDERATYVQSRLIVAGEIYAEGLAKVRFLRRNGGTVDVCELAHTFGVDTNELSLPSWAERWSEDVRLPSNRNSVSTV